MTHKNNLKKVSVKFPNFVCRENIEYEGKRIILKLPEIQDINRKMYSKMFTEPSAVHIGPRPLPRIEGFNCTWRNEATDPTHVTAQFTFCSGEEKKVWRIIEKYNGKIVPSRKDLNQCQIEETNGSGKVLQLENVHETIG